MYCEIPTSISSFIKFSGNTVCRLKNHIPKPIYNVKKMAQMGSVEYTKQSDGEVSVILELQVMWKYPFTATALRTTGLEW